MNDIIYNAREEMLREKKIYKVTFIGSIANLMLLILKFAAGIFGNSAAMLADAVHSLSDFITDIIVILFVKISSKPQDKDHDYGHGKYETLATALIGIILFFVGISILINGSKAILSYLNGEQLEKPGYIALIAAIISIIVKEALYQYTAISGRNINSQAVVANAWHHRSDALSSIGTALGIGGAVLLGDVWRVLDPIAAVIVSIFIIKVSIELLIPCIGDLLEKSLPESTEHEIEKAILEFPEVSHPHNLRTRRIGNVVAVEFHIRMDGKLTVEKSHEITAAIEKRLKRMLGQSTFINIHVEPHKEG